MRDEFMGGLLATVIATPVVIICCGGGGVLFAAILGGIGGLLSGIGAVAALVGALAAMAIWRAVQKHRKAGCKVDSERQSGVRVIPRDG